MTLPARMGLLALLVGCSTLHPLWPRKGLDGSPARTIRIVVPEAYSFTPGIMTHTLPAGTYSFVLENQDGVFFQSPSKILLAGSSGTTLDDGGLFFKGGALTDVYEYIVSEGYYTLRKLPGDFKFSVERKPQ
jgi:hypothetical protein